MMIYFALISTIMIVLKLRKIDHQVVVKHKACKEGLMIARFLVPEIIQQERAYL